MRSSPTRIRLLRGTAHDGHDRDLRRLGGSLQGRGEGRLWWCGIRCGGFCHFATAPQGTLLHGSVLISVSIGHLPAIDAMRPGSLLVGLLILGLASAPGCARPSPR